MHTDTGNEIATMHGIIIAIMCILASTLVYELLYRNIPRMLNRLPERYRPAWVKTAMALQRIENGGSGSGSGSGSGGSGSGSGSGGSGGGGSGGGGGGGGTMKNRVMVLEHSEIEG